MLGIPCHWSLSNLLVELRSQWPVLECGELSDVTMIRVSVLVPLLMFLISLLHTPQTWHRDLGEGLLSGVLCWNFLWMDQIRICILKIRSPRSLAGPRKTTPRIPVNLCLSNCWILDLVTNGLYRIPYFFSPTKLYGQYALCITSKLSSDHLVTCRSILRVDGDCCLDGPTELHQVPGYLVDPCETSW